MPFIIIPAVLLLLIMGIVLNSRLRRRNNPSEPTITPPYLSKPFDRKRRKLPQLFVAWVEQRDKHGAGAWLRALPAKERNLFVRDVAAYAQDMGFDLLWVVDKQIEDVALREQIGNSVYQYVYAFYAATVSQDEMQLYVSLTDFLNNLDSRKYRAESQSVYKQLTERGVVSYPAEQLFFKSLSQRQKHIARSILRVSQTDREAVKEAFRTARSAQ